MQSYKHKIVEKERERESCHTFSQALNLQFSSRQEVPAMDMN